MDREQLQAVQAPIKARYRDQPTAAFVTLRAEGALGDEAISCTVATGPCAGRGRPPPRDWRQRHPRVLAGDMLLEALVACGGVTLRAVATALGLTVTGTVRAEGDLDFRGTLGLGKNEGVPVGFQSLRLTFDLDWGGHSDEQIADLLRLTERYCVVYQTLAGGVPIELGLG